MAHSKTLQFYRNSVICRPDNNTGKSALICAKESLETYGSRNDGEITLMRYQEGDNDPVKTLAAIYHANGNNGSWTYLVEVSIDDYYTKSETDDIIETVERTIEDNELVTAMALTDLDYGKQDVIDDLVAIRNGAAAGASIPAHVRNISQSDINSWNEKMQKVPITMTSSGGTLSFTSNGNNLTHGQVISLFSDQTKYIELTYNGITYHGNYSSDFWTGENLYENIYYGISLDCSNSSAITLDETYTSEYLTISNYTDYAVPTTRTVNNKALSSNVTLNADDIPITVVTNTSNGAVSLSIDAGKFYKFTGSLTSLTITGLNSTTGLAVYAGKFTADANGCTFGVPATVTTSLNYPTTIEGGETYEFSIVDNVLMMIKL